MRHRILRTRGQRIAWSNTSHLPDSELLEAMRFVAQHVDLDRVVVHWKHLGRRRRTYGLAYDCIPELTNLDGLQPREWRYLITMTDHGLSRICPDIIDTLAHEAKHVEAYRERLPRGERRPVHFAAWVAEAWLSSTAVRHDPQPAPGS
jgi:hypothetical protein